MVDGTPDIGRDWIKKLVDSAWPYEIVQCMGDLLDRAEFAEEIARRQILERLVGALNEQPIRSLSEQTKAILLELDDLRRAR